jgi:hypothetical protein
VSERARARLDEHLYATGERIRVRPVQLGDRVVVYGLAGVVDAIAWSAATNERIVTVAHDARIRLRVPERDVQLNREAR